MTERHYRSDRPPQHLPPSQPDETFFSFSSHFSLQGLHAQRAGVTGPGVNVVFLMATDWPGRQYTHFSWRQLCHPEVLNDEVMVSCQSELFTHIFLTADWERESQRKALREMYA